MPAPRVLIFSLAHLPVPQAGFPFVGGAEVAVKEITNRLPDYEFEIISADIRSFWSKYFYPLWAYRRAVRQHQVKNYDLIWAIMANQAGMAAALFKCRFPTVPFLLTLQEGDDLDSLAYRFRLLGPRLFGVFRRADKITAISNYLADWARRMGARCPIIVVPNGVDLGKINFQNKRPDLREIRRSSFDQGVIITSSRLVKKNGVDTLIEAMQFLPDNMRLQILGAGPEEKSLKLKAKSYHLEARIKFLGHIPSSEVVGYLTNADVFVRPSRSEGLGNSFLEAMAAGVPVVGTPVGGIPDFLFDPQWQGESLPNLPNGKDSPLDSNQTGWFCEVNNPKSIAEKVKFILDPANAAKVQEVVHTARNLIHQNYDWSIVSQKMAQIMDNLLSVDN